MTGTDLVRDLGMPDRFTKYTLSITLLSSLLWGVAAFPCMMPAFISPPGGNANKSIIEGFHTLNEEISFNLDSTTADYATSIYFLGSFLLGQFTCALSDKYGRKPLIIIATLATGIASIICGITNIYSIFLFCRFIQGAFYTVMAGVGLVFVAESVPQSCHGKASIIFSVMWCIGYCVVAPIAAAFPTWRLLFLVTAVPTILYAILLQLTLRESVSFLVAQGRNKEVYSWVKQAERINREKFDHSAVLLATEKVDELEPFVKKEHVDHEVETFSSLLKDAMNCPKTVRCLLVMVYMWITDFIVYNGLSLTSTSIEIGDPHWNYALSGFVEFPAAILLPILLDAIGRKPTVMGCHILTSSCLIILAFIPIEHQKTYLCVWMTAKFGIAAAFFALYIYAAELFEVKYRSICVGICCSLGNIGALLVPLTAKLGAAHPHLMLALYAGIMIVSVFLILLLPETSHGDEDDK